MKLKTTETDPFQVVVSLHPPSGNNFVLSCNTTAMLQPNQRHMCPRLLESLAVSYFKSFESLNFEIVQNLKIGSKNARLMKLLGEVCCNEFIEHLEKKKKYNQVANLKVI